MDSRTFTVQQIYQDRRQYRVPFYQRPYVWNRDDQWGRLWEDIRDKADARLEGGKAVPHFMGAVVLEPQKKAGLMGVERHHIIDGQQRLTTLQYVLTALIHTLRAAKHEKLLPLIEACLTNSNPETMEDEAIERFKLWPTFRDRKQYELAMKADSLDALRTRFPASFTQTGSLRKIGVTHPPALEAIVFFHESMLEWVLDKTESDSATRAMALASAVLTDLSIVCISLGDDDDAQVIFETLNGHGAELHATDLIRNFIFMRAGTDADDLYNNLWSQFEAPLWSERSPEDASTGLGSNGFIRQSRRRPATRSTSGVSMQVTAGWSMRLPDSGTLQPSFRCSTDMESNTKRSSRVRAPYRSLFSVGAWPSGTRHRLMRWHCASPYRRSPLRSSRKSSAASSPTWSDGPYAACHARTTTRSSRNN